jgi:hypothetical protein
MKDVYEVFAEFRMVWRCGTFVESGRKLGILEEICEENNRVFFNSLSGGWSPSGSTRDGATDWPIVACLG